MLLLASSYSLRKHEAHDSCALIVCILLLLACLRSHLLHVRDSVREKQLNKNQNIRY